jgi:anti-sigma factor RsiW
MNRPNDLNHASLTAFAVGELNAAELAELNIMLEDPSTLEELRETEAMVSLLTDCLKDEWKSNFAASLEDHRLTDYVFGELGDDDSEAIEAMLNESDEMLAEFDGISEMASLLSASLESEWRSNQPINVDVPDFTNYALEEMAPKEAKQFEKMLKNSVTAQKELSATREFISLLSEGLEREWKSELSATDHEFSLVEATGEENIVSVNFAQAASDSVRPKKIRGPVLISIAAVLAGLLVVGGLVSQSGTSSVASAIVGFSSDERSWFAKGDQQAVVESTLHLRLIEELDQPIENFEFPDFHSEGVKPYYPSASAMVPVAFESELESSPAQENEFNRVDSYLPPVVGEVTSDGLDESELMFDAESLDISLFEPSVEILNAISQQAGGLEVSEIRGKLKSLLNQLEVRNIDNEEVKGLLREILEK